MRVSPQNRLDSVDQNYRAALVFLFLFDGRVLMWSWYKVTCFIIRWTNRSITPYKSTCIPSRCKAESSETSLACVGEAIF